MATLANLSYETAGVTPGSAASWTLVASSTYEELADWGTDDAPAEGFEVGWSNDAYLTELDGTEVVALWSVDDLPAPARAENFEVGWSDNQHYQTLSTSLEAAAFGALAAEGFEAGWGNDAYVFTMGPTALASFANGPAQDFEPFERQWLSNESYATAMGANTGAVFSGVAAEAAEGFELVHVDVEVSVDIGTDEIVTLNHGFAVGYRVSFLNVGGELPGGISRDTPYYVRTVPSLDRFTVSLSPGGSTVDITGTGTGVTTVHSAHEFWTTLMATI